jgi:leader peptidase (prepilin peptidase) / N-methyltransferase
MFDAIEGVKFGYVLCGIIWAVTLGFAVGNYACSLVHRLPRGRLILDKKPYCGNCGTMLDVKDLFPVISAMLLRHRCRYCKEPFPVSHTWTEVLVGLLFVLTFFKYNFSEMFLLVVLVGTFWITLAAIQANEGIIMTRIILCIAVFGMMLRILQDHSIYGAFGGIWLSGIAGVVIWRKGIKPVAHIYSLPSPAILLAVGGLCVGLQNIMLYWALAVVFFVLAWTLRKVSGSEKPVLITVPFGLATMVPVLYPDLLTYLMANV